MWLLTILLTLGTLHATTVTRNAPFAEIRSAACLVLQERGEKNTDRPDRAACTEPNIEPLTRADEFNPAPAPASPYRFQLPPPVFAR